MDEHTTQLAQEYETTSSLTEKKKYNHEQIT
jgi:hypothetical protein